MAFGSHWVARGRGRGWASDMSTRIDPWQGLERAFSLLFGTFRMEFWFRSSFKGRKWILSRACAGRVDLLKVGELRERSGQRL